MRILFSGVAACLVLSGFASAQEAAPPAVVQAPPPPPVLTPREVPPPLTARQMEVPPPPPFVAKPVPKEVETPEQVLARLQAMKQPETWDELPASTRQRMESRLGKITFQPRVVIGPAKIPEGPLAVEAGMLLTVQTIAPAKGVKLTSAPRRDAYGVVGSTLWQTHDDAGDVYCLRTDAGLLRMSRFYCYRDKDNDGTFDALYEGTDGLAPNIFFNRTLGKDEEIRKPVTYVASEPPPLKAIVALRYQGVQEGMIGADGMIHPGRIKFELVYGASETSLAVLQTLNVNLDDKGTGRLSLTTGHRLEIDKVEVSGRARIKVLRAHEAGEGYLYPAITRETVVEDYRDSIQRMLDLLTGVE